MRLPILTPPGTATRRTSVAAVLTLIVASASALAGRQVTPPPTRSHHPDVPVSVAGRRSAPPATPRCCVRRVRVGPRRRRRRGENSAYFLMTEPDRKKPVTVEVDRAGQAGARHRRAASPARPRSTAIRAASSIPSVTTGCTSRRCRCVPRCPTRRASRGRWATPRRRRRGRRDSTARRCTAAVDLAFADPGRPHRGDGRRAQGPDRRRTLHARHHQGHAARELVDGEEPHRHARRPAE